MTTISADYAAQLRLEHRASKWGSTGGRFAGDDVVKLLRERPYIKTVLDFGAGKGTLRDYVSLTRRNLDWTDYDPGVSGIDSLPTGTFDLVVTSDVLEHVEPKHVADTMRLLADFTGKVMYNNIACYPTGKLFSAGPYKGQDMHITLLEPRRWRRGFRLNCPELQEFEYRHTETLHKSRRKTRCVLIHERVG